MCFLTGSLDGDVAVYRGHPSQAACLAHAHLHLALYGVICIPIAINCGLRGEISLCAARTILVYKNAALWQKAGVITAFTLHFLLCDTCSHYSLSFCECTGNLHSYGTCSDIINTGYVCVCEREVNVHLFSYSRLETSTHRERDSF